jgi:hypothetical protein
LNLAKQVIRHYNKRIKDALNEYDITKSLYHIIFRRNDAFDILEYPLTKQGLSKIKIDHKNTKRRKGTPNWGSVVFSIGSTFFRYTTSDHTLQHRFEIPQQLKYLSISRIRDPLLFIQKSFESRVYSEPVLDYKELPFFITPLFSETNTHQKFVERASGLNQWNSSPRGNQKRRNYFEVYLPYNKIVRANAGDFFPVKGVPFSLVLPDGQEHKAKITSGKLGKGISTCPNKYLGLWLLKTLRNEIQDQRFRVITYKDLQTFGSDCIIFFKHPVNEIKYDVFYAPIGFFDKFVNVGFNYSSFPKTDLVDFLEHRKARLNAL